MNGLKWTYCMLFLCFLSYLESSRLLVEQQSALGLQPAIDWSSNLIRLCPNVSISLSVRTSDPVECVKLLVRSLQ